MFGTRTSQVRAKLKKSKKVKRSKSHSKSHSKVRFCFLRAGQHARCSDNPGRSRNRRNNADIGSTGPRHAGMLQNRATCRKLSKKLDIYTGYIPFGCEYIPKKYRHFSFVSELRLCWRTPEIELGTEVHSPGIFVRNERIPKKNRHSGSVLRSYGFFGMGYFYHLVAGANLVDKKKVHFTLVQHRVPL